MASKTASFAFFLVLDLLFFTLVVSGCDTGCSNGKLKPKPKSNLKVRPHFSIRTCPTLKLKVCANVLQGLLGIRLGMPDKEPCCSLIREIVDIKAEACLCTAIKANLLGIRLKVPLSLNLLLNHCGCKVSRGFRCA